MNREIKFRAFSTDRGSYYKTFLGDIQYFVVGDGTQLYTTDIIQLSTGLKDKNGKDIFEGDILGFEVVRNFKEITVHHFAVVWDSENGGWIQFSPKNKVIVVGNIYENPELLEP